MSRSARQGLSLTEVLVIVSIIAILIALILPATRRVREPAARMRCMNNLKQLMLGLHGFESVDRPTDRRAVPAEMFPPGCVGPGATPEERLSWMVALLPYIEQGTLYDRFHLEMGYAGNHSAAEAAIQTFLCPDSKAVPTDGAVTNYVALAGLGHDAATRSAEATGNGFMGYDRLTSTKMIRDGSSNTIALMETQADLGPWARGGPSTVRGFDPDRDALGGSHPSFGGLHTNGIQVAMADGSVRVVVPKTAPAKLAAAITIAGNEPVSLNLD